MVCFLASLQSTPCLRGDASFESTKETITPPQNPPYQSWHLGLHITAEDTLPDLLTQIWLSSSSCPTMARKRRDDREMRWPSSEERREKGGKTKWASGWDTFLCTFVKNVFKHHFSLVVTSEVMWWGRTPQRGHRIRGNYEIWVES